MVLDERTESVKRPHGGPRKGITAQSTLDTEDEQSPLIHQLFG